MWGEEMEIIFPWSLARKEEFGVMAKEACWNDEICGLEGDLKFLGSLLAF